MRARFLLAVVALAAVGCADKTGGTGGTGDLGADGSAPPADTPEGIYYNRFTGGFSGSEWFEVRPSGATGHYTMTDIFGGGFGGNVAPDRTITLDQGLGAGSFSSDNQFVVQPTLGGSVFTFTCTRAPFTHSSFPLGQTTPVAGDPALAGRYLSHTTYHDPETGDQSGAGDEELTLTVTNETLRITDPQGAYFQGVFIAPAQVGFRVVAGGTQDAAFDSFPGSATNAGQDVLGEVSFSGSAFSGTVLLQSRASLGQQTQAVVRFDATRQ